MIVILQIFGILLIFFARICNADALTLVSSNRSDYVIVLSAFSSPAEKYGAEELRRHIKMVTGVSLGIYAGRQSGKKGIFVGSAVSDKGILSNLREEEIYLKTSGSDLFLTGGSDRGTLYAVYEFIEQYLGVDFWSPDEISYKCRKVLEIPDLNIRSSPFFENREIYTTSVLRHSDFAVRMRCNGNSTKVPAFQGGFRRWLGGCHTFDQLIPAHEYLESHPAWFSLVEGKRIGGQGRGQLCLTNPEVLNVLIMKASQWLRKHPDAYAISISQNDNQKYCRCPKCLEKICQTGSASGPLIFFVNQVAAALEKEFPNVQVTTLAYNWSRKPPRNIHIHPNVMIRLCSIEADFAKPLNHPNNREFRQDLEEWKKLTPRIAVWNYTANFLNHLLVQPTIANTVADVRFFADHSVKAVFEQGDSATESMDELSELRTWLLAKLLWNPKSDVNKLTEHFLQGYYGPAAPVIRSYLNYMEEASRKTEHAHTCYEISSDAFLRGREVKVLFDLVNRGQNQLPENSVYWKRLNRLKNNLRVTLLASGELSKWGGDDEKSRPVMTADFIRRELMTFRDYAVENGIRKYSEHQMTESLLGYLAAATGINDEKILLPPELSLLKPKNFAFFPISSCQLYKPGKLAFVERDEASSIGRSVRLETTHTEWVIKLIIPAAIRDIPEKWTAYVRVRMQGQGSGRVFHGGCYSPSAGQQERQFTADEVPKDNYAVMKLGKFKFAEDASIYLAPDRNSDIKNIWFDYLLLVRDSSAGDF